MKNTEKLYIDRLEKMVKAHKEDLCACCPGQKFYMAYSVFVSDAKEWCDPCGKIFKRYIMPDYKGREVSCPCYYFQKEFGVEKFKELPAGLMVRIAWKMIRDWKKDNKEQINAEA